MSNSIGTLLWEALSIMITGMSVVFVFLTLLVYFVTLMSRLVPKDAPPDSSTSKKRQSHTSDDGLSPQLIAAISAAVHQYRSSSVGK